MNLWHGVLLGISYLVVVTIILLFFKGATRLDHDD